jgi:predicted enzyme related to lactoylglutathione lyase
MTKINLWRTGVAAAMAAGVCCGSALAARAEPAPIVFFDIAAPELANQTQFYKEIFGWQVGPDGRVTVPAASPLPGLLRVEASGQGPVAERVIYLGVPDINATLARITARGGAVVFPRTEVPGVVVVALFTDPAGNRMGLVEMDGGKPKIPKPR